jgi:hypothetical protein
MSRAPAAHPEINVSRALENIDSNKTGRVAREQADYYFLCPPPPPPPWAAGAA